MKSKSIEIDLGKIQVNYELDSKGLTCTVNLPWWRVRWLLVKAGLQIIFSK